MLVLVQTKPLHHLLVCIATRQQSVQSMAIQTFKQMNRKLCTELLRQRAPGPVGSQVVLVSALAAIEIQMHEVVFVYDHAHKSLCCELKHLAPLVATLHGKQQCSSRVKC